MEAMEARCIGGPLDGQLFAVPDGLDRWLVAKPPPLSWVTSVQPATEPIPFVTGTYRSNGWWDDGTGNISSVFEWVGWDDERPQRSSLSVLADPTSYVPYVPGSIRAPGDEPGPDAMRWTPDEADAEIEAWQQILHP